MTAVIERAGVKSVQTANKTALKGFPKSKVRAAFVAMAEAKVIADDQNDARSGKANDVCRLAMTFCKANADVTDRTTLVQGWKDHLQGVVMELAVAGNKFAELIAADAKKGTANSARLTGYGQNVASIAKGCIEFSIDPDKIDGAEEVSYRETRKAVEGARAEQRRAKDPALALLEDSTAKLDGAWKELRELVLSFKSPDLLNTLADQLIADKADIESQRAEKPKTEETPTEENTAPTEETEVTETEVTEEIAELMQANG